MANLSNINNKFLVTTGGDVGIGVTGPVAKLEVSADVAKGVLINRTYTTSSQSLANVRAYYGLAITPLRGGTGGLYFTNYDADTPIIQSVNTSDVAQFLLLNPLGGNVGIGTTSPGAKLEVAVADSSSILELTRTGSASFSTLISDIGAGAAQLWFNADTNDTGFLFRPRDSAGNPNNAFLIAPTGNVGIGTTNPLVKLQVYGNDMPATGDAASVEDILTLYRFGSPSVWSGGASLALGRYSAGNGSAPKSRLDFKLKNAAGSNTALPETTVMTMQSNGNIGIGTATPQKKVHIEGTGGASEMQILVSSASDTVGHTAGIGLRGEGGEADGDLRIKGGIFFERIAGSFGNGKMILAVNSSVSNTSVTVADHALTIDTNKNVGIGTTTPSKKLEVAGSYKLGTNAYIQYDAAYPYTINILNTASVGNLIFNAGAFSSGYESKIELQGSNTAGAAGITLSTASSTRMVITADGKIGLDKSNPFYSVDATSFGANTHEWGSGLALFGQDRYSIRELNNLFYSADSRVGGIGTSSNLVSSMFDGNFDTGHTITANTTYVVELDGSGVWNMTYPSGYATISFYYIYTNFTSIVGEQYHYGGTYAGQWRTMDTAVDIRGSAGSTRVVRINSVGNNYVSKWRFTFVTGSSSITVTDIAFFGTRTAGAPVSTYMRGDRTNEWTRTIRFRNNANGIVGSISPGNTSTTFNTTSDYRLKEDLRDFKGLDMISKIPVYDFRWINSEKRSYGVLAHELNEVYPEAVEGKKDAEENQCVDYSKIVPLLVKSIQELKAEIELLKSK